MATKLASDFYRHEFACKCGCGFDSADAELVEVVQDVRDWAGATVTINSGCRCRDHNRAVGGAENSQHLYARAADIEVEGKTPEEVADYLEAKYPGRYGIGRYETFTHVDTRTDGPARWG